MTLRMEAAHHVARQKKAIDCLMSHELWFDSYINLSDYQDFVPIDYLLVFNSRPVGSCEVKGRSKPISNAFPLPISVTKYRHCVNGNSEPWRVGSNGSNLIVWACDDGLIYGEATKIVTGQIHMGGRSDRRDLRLPNDIEPMFYIPQAPNKDALQIVHYQ